jgi:hypothetical protein
LSLDDDQEENREPTAETKTTTQQQQKSSSELHLLPRIGKVSYETVFKAGHQLFTDNVMGCNKVVEALMEL